MALTSLLALLFVASCAVTTRLAPPRLRPAIIAVASYVFYCSWDASMAVVLLVLTSCCYWTARVIRARRDQRVAKTVVAIACAALVLYLCYFKARAALAADTSFVIPLGISYYTFRLISYVVDVYWGKIEPETNWLRFAAYVAFFPHMVAGPIQRAGDFMPQIAPNREAWSFEVLPGIYRILLGLLKKFIVADRLATLVEYGFANAGSGSAVPSALAFYVFPLQLYMDFAALTDIAVGMALLLGVRSPENFDRPFAAPSISEFWRRWHMSLTGWLRDYVFVPARMALRDWGKAGLAASISINMMLVALWHGFRMSFVWFGVLHSAFLVLDVMTVQWRKQWYRRWPVLLRVAAITGPVLTYHLVALADVFFRTPGPAAALHVIAGLFTTGDLVAGWNAATAAPRHWASSAFVFALIAIAGDSVWRRVLSGRPVESIAPRWARWSAYAAMLVLTMLAGMSLLITRHEANPFVYEQF